ncbi:hypothetical protein TTHERM_00994280 (macronuclear) [Tetrahymena thermophila SB210]|uniref:Uncharacterized protein n=1 Tax=Tetrahymena thermophila (strain SB210) TaxID=312017 RepID=Q247R9_TETTS|nr:hypothetical protein TTHERM_00994280 [Tetrahymena thermophila SB210]EAS04031.1 hypothetical protein TTHERM_00994280 [Tetrahymena thermophila SB210]|eukprot:XP_001024276.1 hypothetical protein TTHERM_00994280 [Tetrahymena thermophila SB210]
MKYNNNYSFNALNQRSINNDQYFPAEVQQNTSFILVPWNNSVQENFKHQFSTSAIPAIKPRQQIIATQILPYLPSNPDNQMIHLSQTPVQNISFNIAI